MPIQQRKTHAFWLTEPSFRRLSPLRPGRPLLGTNQNVNHSREIMTPPRMTRRTFWHSSLSLATIGAGSLVSRYARADDNVRHGIQIGALGALRTVLPSIGKKHGLKYDVKDFRDSTSA